LLGYVLAVSCDHRVPVSGEKTTRADALAATLPVAFWQRIEIPCQPGCSLLIRRLFNTRSSRRTAPC
jgi:hypothetical protein